MIPETNTTEITERIAKLKSNVLSAVPTICTERAGFYTEIYQEFENTPVVLKRACALEKTLKKMTIFISEGELIVGNQSSKLRAAPIFPEYETSWIIDELNEFDKRPGDPFFINDRQKEELKRICSWWNGKTSGDAHIAINFEQVLEIGLKGYLQNLENKQDTLISSDERFFEKQDFYNSLIIAIKAFQTFIERFERLSYEMAECETEPERKRELLKISDICGNITEYPPSGFYEALQLTWFIQLILQIESNGHSVSLGRMDQYLYKFYKSDLLKGKIKEDFALELLESTWIKLFSINKIHSLSQVRYSAGGPIYQNITIGGQTNDGKDAVNELSYLILDSVGRLKLSQPNLSVRFHKNMSNEFLSHCEDLMKKGSGTPTFNSDEIVIPALIESGISKDDAFNYSAIGSIEVAVPGRWAYRCTGKNYINFMSVFLASLHNGLNVMSGQTFHDFEDSTSFGEIMKAWREQIEFYTQATVEMDNADGLAEEMVPDILCSAFVDDCIRRGKTIQEGGSVYDFISG